MSLVWKAVTFVQISTRPGYRNQLREMEVPTLT
jgi:hypothetical protein